ncbi:hypothetical protein EWM64_g3218 [Hericium alpestre]|uniref:Uncharacterized protein n=1 Tax=Hericium alpestre TaxID=135208 RepID=A0A4Z0A2X2_9AGAM|nr:hypothetical protein EWM64_g3218 [Hericium alpestre]
MQGENERPIGYKRRQSKGFQGLAEREPVTKSPFRHGVSSEDEPPPVPPKSSHLISRLPTPSSSGSPARSSLVSKRFHGPRILGSELPKRQRRKTVTFDERCDVVEFERDDSGDFDEDPFASTDEEDPYDVHQRYESPLMHGGDDSGDGPDAITGLVDSMLQETQDEPGMHTPPQEHRSLPPDADNEDGVPYGRTHHAERAHANQHPTPPTEDSDPPQLANTSLDFHDVTPPRNRKSLSDVASLEPGSHLPLGRSTHSERMKRDHMPAEIDEDVKMLPPSPSPTKVKPTNHNVHPNRESLIPKFDLGVHSEGNQHADPFVMNFKEEDVQVVELSFMSGSGSSQGDDMDPANLSVGHSEMSLSGFAAELGLNELTKDEPLRTSTPPFSTPPLRTSALSHRRSAGLGENVPSPISRSRSASPLTVASPHIEREPTSHSGSPVPGRANSPAVASPLGIPARVASPFQLQRALGLGEPSSSSSSLGSAGGGVRRPGISRDEMQRRVMTRSHNSPGPWTEGNKPEMPPSPATTESANISFANGPAQEEQVPRSADRAALRREDNATYDGVMSIDPEPQDIDPPRPGVLARSRSDGDVDEENKEPPAPSTF